MALPDQHHLQEINEIAEALSDCERRTLSYLCGSLDTDNSVACMKEMLRGKVLHHETGHLLLRELMLHMRRFDILRKVCQTSRHEVERTLAYRQVLPRFRVLMANISEDMASEDLNSLKFFLSGTLTREKLDKAQSFLDVIIELEKLDIVSPEAVDFVEKCLRNIDRVDLARKVTAYKMSGFRELSVHVENESEIRIAMLLSTENMELDPVQPEHLNNIPLTSKGAELLVHSSLRLVLILYSNQDKDSPVTVSQLELYKFNTNPRGVCLIIDCVGNDGDMLEETFKALHFNVVIYKWLSVQDSLSALRGIFRQRENLEGDGFICCIISRGTENHLLGTDSYSVGLPLNNVRRLFAADSCPMLAGKPKLFFIQRYGVPEFHPCARIDHRDEDLETDGCDGLPRWDFIPTDADVFWSHCWTDERELEQGHHCSIYLKALTDALRKGQRRKTHLVDVHTEVNGIIFEHNKRTPGAKYHIDLKHTLRKHLYLR